MTTNEIPEYIEINDLGSGVLRYFARCTEHPHWRPNMLHATTGEVTSSTPVTIHVRDSHDGIDRSGMPAQLVQILARLPIEQRRQVARAARDWVRREVDAERFLNGERDA